MTFFKALSIPPTILAISKDIRAFKLSHITVWVYFTSLCLQQYGNKFIITFPLNISQLLMMAGCGIMLLDHDRLRLPKTALLMILFMGIVSFGMNFNPELVPTQLKTIFGIIVYFAFSYSLIWSYRNNIWQFLWIYYRIAIIGAGFAIIQVFVWILTGVTLIEPVLKDQLGSFLNLRPEAFGFLPRAIGFQREPSHLVTFLLPGLYFSIQRIFENADLKQRIPLWAAWTITIGFLLTFSLNAYVGLMAIFFSAVIQKYHHYKSKLALAIASSIALFVTLGVSVSSLRVRLIQLVSFDPRNLDTNNLSTFAFLSNGLVTFQALISSNGLGFGINSHPVSYDRFLGKYFNALQVVMRLNSEDAASLYFRLLSEFGLLGLAGFIAIILRSRIRTGGIREQISRAANLCILIIAIRNGIYMEQITWMMLCLLLITSKYSTPINSNANQSIKVDQIAS